MGYRAVREPHKARWVIDETQAPLVRRIFAMCLQAMSTYAIALQLTQERVPTRGHSRLLPVGVWQESTIHKILRNEAYAGRASFGRSQRIHSPRTGKNTRWRLRPRHEWVIIPVPPIVEEATFQAVQRQLQRNRELSRRNTKHEYLLRGGHLRCGRCGRTMSGVLRHGQYRYYRCTSRTTVKAPELRCSGTIRADVVEAQVWAAVVRLLENPELIAAEVARQEAQAGDQRAEIGRQMGLVEASLATCDREAQKWEKAYLADAIELVDFKAKTAEIRTRRASLLEEQAALQANLDALGVVEQEVDALTEYCARVRQGLGGFDHAQKQLALRALDIRVRWTPGQALVIEGSIPLDAIVPTASG